MRSQSCSLLFAALCATSPAAFAQSAPPAQSTLDRTIEDEHRRGMALRAQHQDEAARAVFEALWTRTREPRARARQALAEQSLARYADAEAHLVEALSFARDPWIAQNRALLEPVLQQARAAQGIAILHVRCETADAGVVIGGSEVGSVGSTLRVPPGRVSFEVRAEGFASVSRTVELAPGSVVRVDVSLDRSAPDVIATARAAEQSAAPPERPIARPIAHPIVHPTVLTDLRPAPSPLRPIAWVSAGLAVASASVGFVSLGLGSSAAARWNSDACLQGSLTREQSCPADVATAESMRPLSVAGLVGAGVFATASVALFIAARPAVESPRAVAVRCAPSLGALSCAGVF